MPPAEDEDREEDPRAGAEPGEQERSGDAARCPPKRRSRAFREGLIARLPSIGFYRASVADSLSVGEDLAGIATLDADAFLEPLQRLREGDHE
jgi:hypothetical protein